MEIRAQCRAAGTRHKGRLLDGLRGEEGFPAEVTNALGPTMGVGGGQVWGRERPFQEKGLGISLSLRVEASDPITGRCSFDAWHDGEYTSVPPKRGGSSQGWRMTILCT